MQKNETSLLKEVAQYYSDKLAEHGDTPRGVDWNSSEGQVLRFEQFCGLFPQSEPFSVNDLGCGYGALFEHLVKRYSALNYTGVDVSADMVRAAVERQGIEPRARFIVASEPDSVADFGVASGIFNVRLGRSDAEWEDYLLATLDVLHQTSKLGFAFNCLTTYSDVDRRKDYLYYADPCELFDLCKRRYSNKVALLHDYPLYEFTILVRKTP